MRKPPLAKMPRGFLQLNVPSVLGEQERDSNYDRPQNHENVERHKEGGESPEALFFL
jgi:hypothetical protein